MPSLGEAQRQYQAAMEHVRAVREVGVIEPEDEQALADAIRELETAWLEAKPVR